MNYIKEPHTALFVAQTGIGKTYKALNLIETEYKNHFDYIIIICPTLKYNKTYRDKKWIWEDPGVILIEPENKLYEWIKCMSDLISGFDGLPKTLFLIDDIIADEKLDKKRQPLLELAISGRHRNQSLWILTQSYTAIPKNIRRQSKMLYVWYPKNKKDLQNIYEENDVIETTEELNNIKNELKGGKHTCLIIRMEYPRMYKICS